MISTVAFETVTLGNDTFGTNLVETGTNFEARAALGNGH